METVGRYLLNESAFKADAFAVLKSHFRNRREFNKYYASIKNEKLDDFLRICASYRYLAKHGDWKITVGGRNLVVDYLTNSFKLVAVFSLIESLSELEHRDFYQWLTARVRRGSFPIVNREDLDARYREYKAEYGAVRRCVGFFSRLPLEEQNRLCGSISVNRRPIEEIERLAELMYNVRSGFVHKGEFAHELSGPVFVLGRASLVESRLTIASIFRAFELGVIEHFRCKD